MEDGAALRVLRTQLRKIPAEAVPGEDQHHGVAVVRHLRIPDQSLAAQRDALTTAGCDRIFTDQLSGVREDRPGLVTLLDYVRNQRANRRPPELG